MSVSKNYVYNLIYQITILITPFITTPYIARVLGSEGIGISAFTDSIVQYFILFGTLGINNLYGTRTIAYVRDDINLRSKAFWELNIFKIISIIVILTIFYISIIYTNPRHMNIFFIQSINIIAAFFDISWFFMGLEEFKKTVARNMLVKITGIIFLFTLVKDFDDLWIYVSILVFSNLLGNLSLWAYLPKYVNMAKPDIKEVKRHLILALKLFVPQIASQIYVIMDRTMIGLLANDSEVGLYDVSQRIIRLTLTIITSTSLVLLPKISNLMSQGETKQVKDYIYKSFQFSTYLAIPLALGIVGISTEFIPWFLGNGFEKVITLIAITSPIIIAVSWSNVTGTQLLISAKMEKELTISIVIAAISNVLVNFTLIPKFLSIGSAIATIVAEFEVIAIQLYFVSKIIPIKNFFREIWKYAFASIIMFIIIKIIGFYMGCSMLTTIVQVICADMVYVGLLLLLKSDINKMVLEKIYLMVTKK